MSWFAQLVQNNILFICYKHVVVFGLPIYLIFVGVKIGVHGDNLKIPPFPCVCNTVSNTHKMLYAVFVRNVITNTTMWSSPCAKHAGI